MPNRLPGDVLTRRARRALLALRSGWTDRRAGIAGGRDLDVRAAPIAFVSDDERALLTIAVLIRRNRAGEIARADIIACLSRIAFAPDITRMPLTALDFTRLADRGWLTSERHAARAGGKATDDPGSADAPYGSLKRAAMAIASSADAVSTATFVAGGISRQYLNRIVRNGLIERIGHGRYRLATAA